MFHGASDNTLCTIFSAEQNMSLSVWQGDVAMDSDAEAEGKKELRKAKNRASAAASRARREAYTASLEAEVTSLRHPLRSACP